MPIRHRLQKRAVESINFIPAGMGEAGWMIYLNEGYSFDPMSPDWSRFIPSDSLEEAMSLIAYKLKA
jgi:hypothetical protein